jgi:hypothetical protein
LHTNGDNRAPASAFMRDVVPHLLALMSLVGTFVLRSWASIVPSPLVLATDGPAVAAGTFWMGA